MEPQQHPQPQQPNTSWPPQAPPPTDSAHWQTPVTAPPLQPSAPANATYQPTNYGSSYGPADGYTQSTPTPQAHPTPAPQEYKGHHEKLSLSKGEVLLRDIHRHPIGVLQIYFVAAIVLLALLIGGGALIRYLSMGPQDGIITEQAFPFPVELITWMCFGLGLLTVVISAIAIRVYNGNRLYLTNESVIQRIQVSLFHTKEQQIPLGNVEDVSYEQGGIFPHIFHYGTIRLSTEGEETTYYFRYASNPKEQVFHIVNAQEEFNRQHPSTHH